MRIVIQRPPLWDEIVAAFPAANRPGTIFTWGHVIYNPGNGNVTKELIAHEEIHAERQGQGDEKITAWWRRYLIDPAFRVEEEWPAHRMEYLTYCRNNKTHRDTYLKHVATRLCGPLYGNLLSFKEARHMIVSGQRITKAAK